MTAEDAHRIPRLISIKDQVLMGAASRMGWGDSVKILIEKRRMQLARVPMPATRKAASMPIFWRRSRGIFQMRGMGSAIIITSVMMVKMLVAVRTGQ